MAIHVALDHSTHYRYGRPIRLSPQTIRLHPAPHTRTFVHGYHLDIQPSEHRLYWQQDPFGNTIAQVVFPKPVTEFGIHVRLIADMTVINPFDFYVEAYAEHYPFKYDAILRQELEPYFEITESGPKLMEWLAGVDRHKQHIVTFLVALNMRLQQSIGYTIRMEPGIQTCEETFEKRLGSCRDTGWLLVQILRHLGLAARFVSGYLVQLKPDEVSLDGPSGTDHDFTDLHAWAEVYIPGAGWIGLDPTSGLFAGEGHIPLACTPDPVSAAPLTGFSEPCEDTDFEFANVVTRIHEDPRVTKPYTDEQWEAIRHLGRQVDDELNALDTRLTMGGEPTFVSIDDMEGAEWNTEALGFHKRERAGVLLKRLREAFATGGFLHYGQGKWYPGEPLPRWALGCYWRLDGQLLWQDLQWIADEARDYGYGQNEARQFGERLVENLNLDTEFLVPGHEDWIYYLWREAKEPANVDPVAIAAAPQFRDELSLALARGLDQPVGYALPIKWNWARGGWQSWRWEFSRGEMYLTPGSSPMGYRLPLNELPWMAATVSKTQAVSTPVTQTHPVETVQSNYAASTTEEPALEEPQSTALSQRYQNYEAVPHTALCIEARQGRLYVFMPLLENLDQYSSLLKTVEQTAAELHMPVLIEGNEPPAHPLMKSLKVTPDPGVIEVNIHPANNWEELEHNTTVLYEEARLSRLGTEKFMLDGRHTGTGGGNHVTLGGPTAADSPFLRRPDLLRSLITYWQHHPSLSYLFSGLFIGPTSQAPRVDERGNEWLRELEKSFEEIEQQLHPTLIDRALRNYLTDISGNTHRAEFCIDKLFSADSASGRQGLVEFRGFEMPPHARMSLAQTLLLRALVARFWQQPYHHPLVNWGTDLHDRFMLPEMIWTDFQDVIKDLRESGYAFELSWYLPFLEFRFPLYGRANYDGIDLELRMALEPWLVLEESQAVQQQSRMVDAAIERLQVKCRGLDPERYFLTCNGRRIPLSPCSEPGTLIAGVRYKAWNETFGLHPTLELNAPVVIDVFDRWLGRAIGGCVYHVEHPGGRNAETFPVNAYEAEARRVARFWQWGHTPGESAPPPWIQALRECYAVPPEQLLRDPPEERPNPEYPYTLDLRRHLQP